MLVYNALSSNAGIDPGISSDGLAEVIRQGSRAAVLLGWIRRSEQGASEPLSSALREAAAREALLAERLGNVLNILARAGVPALVIKGAAISNACYPEPWLRPRNDDDVLVPERDFERARRALAEAGYASVPQNPGAAITGQAHFRRAWPDGHAHHVDLHARPLVPDAFRTLPSFEELTSDAVPLDSIGGGARGPSRPIALLLICAHRVAHHTPTEDPTWLVDLHLMAERLSEADWPRFAEVAERSRMAQVCATELSRAVDVLGTRVPPGILARLGAIRGEPSARHLVALGPLYSMWLDVRGQADFASRLRLVGRHLVPPREFIHARFGPAPAYQLPWLYARRAAGGSARWLREFVERRWRS